MKFNLQVEIAWQGKEDNTKNGGLIHFDFIPFGISLLEFPAKKLVYIFIFPGVVCLGFDIKPKVSPCKS